MSKNRVTASLSTADSWTDWMTIPKNADSMVSRYGLGAREMFIMASNSFTGALTIQCRDDETGQIANAETFPAGNVVKNGLSAVPGKSFRIGFLSAATPGGTADVILERLS